MAGGSSPSPAAAPVQVRCAGCRGVLAVGPGVTEFICPKCRMAQRLPPQLMPKSTSSSSLSPPPKSPAKPSFPPPTQPRKGAPPAQGVDPTKIQLPCAHCQAVLNVPHGLARFRCPQCGVDLAVDHAKLQNFLASSNSAPPSGPAPASGLTTQVSPVPFLPILPPGVAQPLQPVAGVTIPMVLPAVEPEEINEVAIDVEREEDEGGTVGETFTDYRPPKLSLGLPHPDPVVETSSLSAVQPPEPTYNLNIMDELDDTKALSCLQIETIVYACQRHTSSTTSPVSNNASRNFSAEDESSDTQDTPRSKLDDIVCTVCHDGQSPKHNRIVLCDKCDVPYHQQCHVPSIEDRVAEITTAEWMCSKCEEVKSRKRRRVEPRISVSNNGARDISGNGLTEEQKIAYLSSLPQRVLIDLILIAEKLHPDLPLYPADVKEQISNNVYASLVKNNVVDNRPASKDSLPYPPIVPQAPSTQNPKSYAESTDPSRAHLPVVGVDLPSYEEMIVQALLSIADPAGSAPRNI